MDNFFFFYLKLASDYKNDQGHAQPLPPATLWVKFDPGFVEKGISGSENIFYTSDI